MIYIFCISILTFCVKLDAHYTGKFNFILYKNNNLKSFRNKIDGYYQINNKFGGFNSYLLDSNASSSLDTLDTLTVSLTNNQDSTQDLTHYDRKSLFGINKKGIHHLRTPIKLVLESIVPDILTVFEARENLGYGPLPSLLSCSGGVDSMSLLHSFGIIKTSYEEIIGEILTILKSRLNNNPFKIKSETTKLDHQKRKVEVINFLKKFYDNFKVVYFNHKQREDVDKDIEVIKAACEKYKFDLIIEELPQELESKSEVSKYGPQLMFRKWRRETCIKIIDGLSSADSTSKIGDELRDLEHVMKFLDENLVDLQTVKTPEDLIGLKGLVFMGHHLNDNFETLLLKISRDTSIINLGLNNFQDINEKYHADSTNDELHYERNILRKNVIPSIVAGINGTYDTSSESANQSVNEFYQNINNLSKSFDAFKESIEKEVEMFFYYINSKYKSQSTPYSSSCLSNTHSTDAEKESYKHFYTILFKRTYGEKLNSFELRFRTNLAYFNRIGLKFPRLFSLKDLNIIPNQIVKEQVIKRYVEYFNGSSISNQNLRYILDRFTKSPFTNFPKLYCIGNHYLFHQGYHVNFQLNYSNTFPAPKVKKGSKPSLGNDEDTNLVYSDETLSVYNYLQLLNVCVTPDSNKQINSRNVYESVNGADPEEFHVDLLLKEKMNRVEETSSKDLNTNDKDNSKIHIDIRYLNDDDIVPSAGMWKNKAHVVLTNANIHKIIKDEIPAFVISGTNQVIGIYGVNLRAPYFCNDHQTIEYGSEKITLPVKYRINIH
ncbi:uncharacterized protein TA03600 [Theileria annulata]|uniref:tRNA(Ile)-2-lysyl-cytidine synthase n=1 Tax=Theileria annulata TaxID=5874 RepID=Q4UCH8_THEAN|nr:uncharacterized protein TA03600 [Theileria annulata]CAI75473.1 hypothetical protein, conserved [Theileria annulata]|eukprot:XP_954949.1 hypothetical protein, conserved [Theileria annulata]